MDIFLTINLTFLQYYSEEEPFNFSSRQYVVIALPLMLVVLFQDADFLLDVNQCTKSESGKVYIQEPLDCLLSCISWMLLLQPHGKTDHPSDSWTCFGFSLTQENEVL